MPAVQGLGLDYDIVDIGQQRDIALFTRLLTTTAAAAAAAATTTTTIYQLVSVPILPLYTY